MISAMLYYIGLYYSGACKMGVNMSYVCYVHTINCSQRHPSLAAFRIFGCIWCSKLTQKYNMKSGWFKILKTNQ